MTNQENKYELIKFEDGEFSLDVNISPNEDTVWLCINDIASLFQRDISVVGKHIRNILKENELKKESVWAKFAYTATDGKTYLVDYYNLDMILAVGYRVNSKRGILFRRWATSILKQYLLKGISINEKRCLAHSDNLYRINQQLASYNLRLTSVEEKLDILTNKDTILNSKLFYENEIYDAYSYIKQLFLSATTSIIIIDGYVDLSVLDMLSSITISITVYTYPSTKLTKQDIDKFKENHDLTIVKTNKIHDRFIIIDSIIYSTGASIKDAGKKRFVMTKIESISVNDLLKNIC